MGKARFTETHYSVCHECLFALAYDEYDGVPPERFGAIRKGVEGLGWVSATGEELGHGSAPCDCCRSYLHGDRYRATKLERVKR